MDLVILEDVVGKLFHQGSHVAVINFVGKIVHFKFKDRSRIFVLTESSILSAKRSFILLCDIGLFKVELDHFTSFQ